ncbi:MAG: FIST N-terminal domain-containing protein [Candidatus Omnitrophica bacterium]|nr:FIST N-terminal domain-containing protein [Candidatus Omnitrophota bacterium]
MQIGLGVSTDKNIAFAAQEAVKLAKSELKNAPDLAIVFSSTDMASSILLKTISAILSDIPIIGASASVLFANQEILEHGVAILLVDFPDGVHFNTAFAKGVNGRSTLAAEEIGEGLLYGFKDIPRILSVVLSDGLTAESTNFIAGLQERLGRSFPLTGASASDHPLLKSQLFFNKETYSDACVGLLIGGKINFGLGIKHGWNPLGKPHIATKTNDNLLIEIDGQPTVEFYQEYLGCDLKRLKKDLNRISIFYPIGVYIPGEKEYLLRNIVSLQPDGAMRFQGNIPEKSTIRIMIGTKETCLDATRQAAEEAMNSLLSKPSKENKNEIGKKFALVFSSISRHELLRRDVKKELEAIKQVLGDDTPILGIYTHGELAPLKAISYRGQVYFHNQSIAILIIGG